MYAIKNKMYRLKKDTEVTKNMQLKANQEISIVNDVVYVDGYPIQSELQGFFYNWIMNNPTLFDN